MMSEREFDEARDQGWVVLAGFALVGRYVNKTRFWIAWRGVERKGYDVGSTGQGYHRVPWLE